MTENQESVSEPGPFRFTRLPGPTAREIEEQAASYVEESLQIYDSRLLGPRTRKDGRDDLRVDFTFDSTDPPVAMEVTALTSPDIAALNTELLKLETELDELTKRELLGGWVLGIVSARTFAAFERCWSSSYAARRTESGVCMFSSDEAPGDLDSAGLSLITRALDCGLENALRNDNAGVAIFPPIAEPGGLDRGFATLLRTAVSGTPTNSLKRDRERHTSWCGLTAV